MTFEGLFGKILAAMVLVGRMPGYSAAELRGIRRSCPKFPRLQQTVFNRIRELGLFGCFRGCRAGYKVRSKKQNGVSSSSRKVGQYPQMQYFPNVNKPDVNTNELIYRIPSYQQIDMNRIR